MKKNIFMSERGSTLIEVLITVLVVSIGLLGMSSLQLKSTALNHDSSVRTDAANLANDIAARLYVNALTASSGLYTIALGAAKTAAGDVDTVAEEDLNRWADSVARFSGQFSISNVVANAGKPAFYAVRVCWPSKFLAAQSPCDNSFSYEAVRK